MRPRRSRASDPNQPTEARSHRGPPLLADLVGASGDQGDDDFLLVVEMAQDPAAHVVENVGQAGGGVGAGGGAALHVLMEGDGGLKQGFQIGMDGVMIAVEQVYAMGDPRFDPAEGGKILAALDAVTHVQVLQELIDLGDQSPVQAPQVRVAGPPVIREGDHVGVMLTKVVVHAEPEPRHLGQRGLNPALTGVGWQKHPHVFGQPVAQAQVQRIAWRGGGRLRQGLWSS